jgi:hypothetical protein
LKHVEKINQHFVASSWLFILYYLRCTVTGTSNLVIALWPGDNNNQFSGGIAVNPVQKIPSAEILWKIYRLDFLDQESIHVNYLPKGLTINAEYDSSLLAQLKDILKKTPRAGRSRGSYSCTTMPRLTGHLQCRRN